MADPAMVTDDLIRTRQAIFQQPDWLKACESNMALQDPETRRRNMLTDDDLRSIQAPALVVWTTKDPSGPVDEGRRIAGLIPNGRLAVIENAGHWPQYEQTEIFNKIQLDFLLGLDEGADTELASAHTQG
jgi:2-hydroxy-6-oxonona-2,4-dienedioate hydrolase